MLIRQATAADATLLHRFIVELATYERERDAVEVTPAILAKQLADDRPPFEALIAETDRPIGFALFVTSYSTWLGKPGLWLEDLYVTPEARGRGYGRALLAALAERAHARGCGRLEWAVLDWNTPAQGFYRTLGARPVDGWTRWRLTGDSLTALGTE